MSARNKPLFVSENGVKIYGPTSTEGKGKYFRIQYPDGGGYGHTTAKSEDLAIEKASLIATKLKRGSASRCELSVSEFIDAYLDATTRQKVGKRWGAKHTLTQKSLMNLHIRPHVGSLVCTEITNELLRDLVMKAGDKNNEGSISKAEHVVRNISAWIQWGALEGWVTADPEKVLAGLKNCLEVLIDDSQPTESGESVSYVQPSDIPSHEEVDAVAKAAAEVSGQWWYELMFNLAAYSGLRLGEIIDLDITKVDLAKKTIRVNSQCLEAGGKKTRRIPKMKKNRFTVFPTMTPSGYPLLQELTRRMAELEALAEIPTLIDGSRRRLLFPNRSGSWLSQGSFGLRVRRPAQELAGWPKDKDDLFVWDFHSLRHVFCSYYLGDLGIKASSVALAAGHSSTFVTLSMYVGASKEALSEMSKAN